MLWLCQEKTNKLENQGYHDSLVNLGVGGGEQHHHMPHSGQKRGTTIMSIPQVVNVVTTVILSLTLN